MLGWALVVALWVILGFIQAHLFWWAINRAVSPLATQYDLTEIDVKVCRTQIFHECILFYAQKISQRLGIDEPGDVGALKLSKMWVEGKHPAQQSILPPGSDPRSLPESQIQGERFRWKLRLKARVRTWIAMAIVIPFRPLLFPLAITILSHRQQAARAVIHRYVQSGAGSSYQVSCPSCMAEPEKPCRDFDDTIRVPHQKRIDKAIAASLR